jgi:hypothetical protein
LAATCRQPYGKLVGDGLIRTKKGPDKACCLIT